MNTGLREKIAKSIHFYLERKMLPEKIEASTQSTIIKARIFLSENETINKPDLKEVDKVIEFSKFLEDALNDKFLTYFEHKLEELIKEENELK